MGSRCGRRRSGTTKTRTRKQGTKTRQREQDGENKNLSDARYRPARQSASQASMRPPPIVREDRDQEPERPESVVGRGGQRRARHDWLRDRGHRELGPGLLEHFCQRALCLELGAQGIGYESERPIKVMYRGAVLGVQRLDLLVEGAVIVEVKSVGHLETLHGRAGPLLLARGATACRIAAQFQRGAVVNPAPRALSRRRG